ncbi:MAG: transporter, partial [Betaproteobacteria bacterium]
MKSRSFRRTRLAAGVGAALLSLSAGHALGAAFALQEQNASGLGHAYAGGAAAAEDVSTIFYNPAGLVRLQTMQAVVAGNVICPSAKFHDNGSQAAAFQPLGGTGGDAGSCAVVPNLYLGIPFTDKWSFGIGVNVPFGLKTEYDSDWLGRFQAVKS